MNRLRVILCPALAALLCACRTFVPEGLPADSALSVSLAGVSAEVSGTKATPSELGNPLASEFNIKVVRNSNGAEVYNKALGEHPELIKVASGEPYTVTASYGKNSLLAINEPYYVGTEVVSVETGETRNVEVECKVGNSLISARFGSDQTGQERFGKYFSDCSLDIYAGDFMASLPMGGESISAYLRSGSDFSVAFSGVMKDTGEKRSFDLPSDMVPDVLNAADHLIITLDLKIETGVDITISKAEIVEEGLDRAIPFSWLPLPTFTSSHKYDQSGLLAGTDLECSASYPGCVWNAYVRNSAGTLVRTLSGEGSLSSLWPSSSDWPYLPSGTYTATFSYQYNGQTVNIEGRQRTFTIAPPSSIKAAVSGYTSFDKYVEGNVAAANNCNAFTLYDIEILLGLSDAIRSNSNYSGLISSASGSVWVDENIGRKNFTGLSAGTINSLAAGNHNCNVSFSFDGVPFNLSLPFVITGLPYTAVPPTKENGWSVVQGGSKVSFGSSYLSIADGGTATADPTVQSPSFFCPAGISSIDVQVSSKGTVYTRNVLINYHCKFHIYQAGETIYTKTSDSTKGNAFTYSEDRLLSSSKNYFRMDTDGRTELSGYARINEFKVVYR